MRLLRVHLKTLLDFIFNSPSVTGVAGGHHVLGVKHLLSELRNGEGAVLLGSTRGEGGESGHEEVETGEGDLNNLFLTIDLNYAIFEKF